MKTISVTCAILIHEGRILAAQRSEAMDLSGKWEFPGGKVEPGENSQASLIREIKEELGIDIELGDELTPISFSYPAKSIRLIPFLAYWKRGEIRLAEHSAFCWLEKKELLTLNWAEADLPIVHELIEKWVKLVESKES